MKVYCPNTKGADAVGGGWTFLRNFRKAIAPHAFVVDRWEDADVVLITGITMTDKDEIHAAKAAGKRIVLRVDNVPRKSRNRRSTPHERLREFAAMADCVVYQSEWAKDYCAPLCGDGAVIYNGVDTGIFRPAVEKPDHPRYLFAYHGKSELKQYWRAHLLFQYIFRRDPTAEFWFINDFGRDGQELIDANFDFWQGERYAQLPKAETPQEMAEVMRQCTHLLYPSISDAAPNLVLEARACGLEVVGAAPAHLSGTQEMIDMPIEDIGLDRMGEEYAGIFNLLVNDNT